MSTYECVNFDCLTTNELEHIATHGGNYSATQIAYAVVCFAARRNRLFGNVGKAIDCEKRCEKLYNSLPEELQW